MFQILRSIPFETHLTHVGGLFFADGGVVMGLPQSISLAAAMGYVMIRKHPGVLRRGHRRDGAYRSVGDTEIAMDTYGGSAHKPSPDSVGGGNDDVTSTADEREDQ